ncbi:MAG: hypothetical protein AAF568_13360 [Pseudomonadota bacterium]
MRYSDGVSLYGNRTYWQRFAKVIAKLATCPPDHHCESHVVLAAGNELIGVFDAKGSVEDEGLQLELLNEQTFDVNHMCVEDHDFARYEALAADNRGGKDALGS